MQQPSIQTLPLLVCVHAFVCVCVSVSARVFPKDKDITSEQAYSSLHCGEAESLSPQAARLHAVLEASK